MKFTFGEEKKIKGLFRNNTEVMSPVVSNLCPMCIVMFWKLTGQNAGKGNIFSLAPVWVTISKKHPGGFTISK